LSVPYRLSLGFAALACALAPAYTIRWHIGFYPTTLLEVAILVTIVVFAIETVRQHERVEWRTPFTLPAALFLIGGALSVIVAPDHRAAIGLYRAYLVEPIAFFFVVSAAARTPRRALVIFGGLAVGGLVVAVWNGAVVTDFLRRHAGDPGLIRPVVIYTTPNAVPLFVVPMIAVAASIAVYASDLRQRLASVLFVVIAGAACLLSFSLGGLLALAAVGLGLALTHRYRFWLLGVILLAFIALTRIPAIAHRIALENPNYAWGSLTSRRRLWGITLQMLRDHPIFGPGMAAFGHAIDPYRNGFTEQLIDPHFIILNFWTETGLLGVVAFTWIMIQAFIVSWRGWRRASAGWRPLHLGVTLALVAVVVHGLVDVPYWKNDLSLEFWALLGLTWAGTRWDQTRA
jgi:O-antigen ligase